MLELSIFLLSFSDLHTPRSHRPQLLCCSSPNPDPGNAMDGFRKSNFEKEKRMKLFISQAFFVHLLKKTIEHLKCLMVVS